MTKKDYAKGKNTILILAPSLEIKAGVADFCRMLIDNLSPDFQVFHLRVGRKSINTNFIKRLASLLRSIFCFIWILNKNAFDVIQINPSFKPYSLMRDSIYLFIINMFRLTEKTVVFFHGWDHNLAEWLKGKALLREMFITIYKKVGIISVLSNSARQQLVALGIDPHIVRVSTTMYKGFRNSDQKDELLEKKNNKIIHILFMSRFLKEKGVFIAAEVARILTQNGFKEFKFIFAGEGPEEVTLRNYIIENKLKDFVEISGFVSGKNKKDILENSEIFLLPTYCQEGCPIVILEAMGAGLAIVATPAGAIPDIVKHNKNGFIIKSKNPRDFYEAINKLIGNKELLRSFQEANRIKAENNYETKIVTRKIESFYRSIING